MTEIGLRKYDQDKCWTLLLTILYFNNLDFDDAIKQVNKTLPCIIIASSY